MYIFLSAVGIVYLILIFYMILNISNYFRSKSVNHVKEEKYTHDSQIKTINEFIDLIDRLIVFEVAYVLRREITLGKNYNPMNIDSDCETISNKVYNYINSAYLDEISHPYLNVNNILTDDYWLNYIVERTTITMLDAYNKSFGTNVQE